MLKKMLASVLVVTMVISFMLSVNVLAWKNDYCEFTGNQHDFWMSRSYTVRHPHSGEYTCDCGEEVYYSRSYSEECEECQLELCEEEDIHYYLANVVYTDYYGFSGYCECYCGERAYFTSGERCDEPHYIHNDYGSYGCCGMCELESIYGRQVDELNFNNILEFSFFTQEDYESEYVYFVNDNDAYYKQDDDYDYGYDYDDEDYDVDYDYPDYDDYDDYVDYSDDYDYPKWDYSGYDDEYYDDVYYDYDFEYDEDDYYYY